MSILKVLIRRAQVADELPGNYKVNPGQDIMISVYNIHHSSTVIVRIFSYYDCIASYYCFLFLLCAHKFGYQTHIIGKIRFTLKQILPCSRAIFLFLKYLSLCESQVWDRAEEFIPERFDLDGPVPNESNTDYRYPIFFHLISIIHTLDVLLDQGPI